MVSFVEQRNKRQLGGILLSVLIAGCGGGSGEQVSMVTRVESRVQSADAVQEPSSVKSAPVSDRVKPSIIGLGNVAKPKVQLVEMRGARLIGHSRTVEQTRTVQGIKNHLQWEKTPSNGWKSALGFKLNDAFGLRMGVRISMLPGEAIVRVYSPERPEMVFQLSGAQILQMIKINLDSGDLSDEGRTWWTPDIGHAHVVLEIELPPGVDVNNVSFTIPAVSEIFENISLPTEQELRFAKIGESASCHLDSNCYDEHASKRNAVARMLFTRNGQTYVCSGTLLNDKEGSGTPYFLSANHCISSQTVASTLQTDWFYRSPSCNNLTLSNSTSRRFNGATLLYASTETDISFMRLTDTPPAGATFAGWDASAQGFGASVVGIHHPRGDLQKISFGSLRGFTSCFPGEGSEFSCFGTTGKFYTVNWSQGTTEGGSSGSAIWKDGYVIGTLYGGAAACTTTNSLDIYGRFDVAYAAKIKEWLASATEGYKRVPVYRFYNTKTGAHFYTMSVPERDNIIASLKEFNYEGALFYAYAGAGSGLSPVYRFYNSVSGAHFYTISPSERDNVIALLKNYNFEGSQWYAQQGGGNDSVAMYRFFNSKTGAHFYTINTLERDFVIAYNKEFSYEGPVYYAWTTK